MMQHRNFTRVAHARSYAGGRLRNPFFSHEPRHINPRILLFVIITMSLGLFASFLYLPLLQYSQVEIYGLTTLTPNEVEDVVNNVINHRRFLIVPGRQLFLMKSSKVISDLNSKYNFANITLTRSGRHLKINATERITQVAWLSGDKTYLLDLSGTAVKEAQPEVIANIAARKSGNGEVPVALGIQPTMPIIITLKAEPVTLGQQTLDVTRLANILVLDDLLRDRGLTPLSYTFDDASKPWVTVQNDLIALYIDVTQNVVQTISMFDTYKAQGGTELSTLKYLDLRFGNHLYIQPE
jgi:hypothetical protein